MDGIVGPVTGRALVHPRTYQAQYPRGGALRVEISLSTRVLVLYQHNQIALISHAYTASGPRSPVRTRIASSTLDIQIFPSPMSPVLTALAIASATSPAS